MGRKKIAIQRIQDERNRQITFSKRKSGLLKKAYELSILCDCEIAVIMITSNNKLYQYASSNMNSILIRYTEFKDPDESKTNADILEDITKKERGASAHDDSGDEDEQPGQFMLTPRIQAQYRKLDEEFDQMLRHNQLSQMAPTLNSAPASSGVPQVMPVRVPVAPTAGSLQQQLQQHLQERADQRSGSTSSSSMVSSLLSPPNSGSPGDLSASPSGLLKGHKSPSMPPPMNTPARLQTLKNQTLKLHLPGSGRNYISLSPGGAGKKPSQAEAGGSGGRGEGDEGEGGVGGTGGTRPPLRVVIPGQKEFVPRTQTMSPLPPVAFGAAPPSSQQATTTNTESLTTPILSLATPNLFSSLPPLSSLTGDFPFNSALMGGSTGGDQHSALVAFPVSIQPSSVSGGGGSSTSNIILQAQNMGQPFLLTPTFDPRSNPLVTSAAPSQLLTPPTSTLGAAGISPMPKDLESLKLQYDRLQQQLLQQQFLLQQGMHAQLQQRQQHQSKEGGSSDGGGGGGGGGESQTPQQESQEEQDSGSHSQSHGSRSHSQSSPFLSSSDVLISSQTETTSTVSLSSVQGSDGESEPTPAKRPRLSASGGTV